MNEFPTGPFHASDYLDCDEWGVLSNNGLIVIGHSCGLSKEQCEKVAKYWNERTVLEQP